MSGKCKMQNTGQASRRRGVTMVELLAAVFILSIVAASAAATWNLSSKVPGNLRVTEMSSKIAVQEIEVVKAQKYDTAGFATSMKTIYAWYDKNGALINSRSTTQGTAPSNASYLATTTIGAPLDASGSAISGLSLSGTTSDLLEVKVVVQNSGATKTYETQRTLMAFGGF